MSRFLAPDYIRNIQPYPVGKPVDVLRDELGVERIIPLASNENTAGPSPRALAALAHPSAELFLYPDGGGTHLTHRLAAFHGVEPEQIILGNGSAEIIDVLCRAFVTDSQRVVVSSLGFAQFRLSAASVNAHLVEVPTPAETRKDSPEACAEAARSARLVFLANPNNPTGTWWSRSELDTYFEGAGDEALTVVDQAYFEYVDAPLYPDALDDLRAGRNVLVLRTFSKAHALAALRIGYGITSPEVAEALHKTRLPFNTNTLAQAAALASLDDTEHIAAARERNLRERPFLAAELSRRGLRVTPSVTNFLLVDFPRPAREVVGEVSRSGILIRPMGGYGLPYSIRITVGSREENEALLAALDAAGFAP